MDRVPVPKIGLRGPYRQSVDHIVDELARIDLLVRAQVIRWQHSAATEGPESDWGMVVVSGAEVDRYLKSPPEVPGLLSEAIHEDVRPWLDATDRLRTAIDKFCSSASAPDLRLRRLTRIFGLVDVETDILLLCLLADLDERYRRLFAYLQNDASRQSLQVNLILQILGSSLPETNAVRDLFSPSGSLLAHRLIVMNGDTSSADSLPLRSVRIDDRVSSFLLGSDALDSRLAGIGKLDETSIASPIYGRPETCAFLRLLPESLQVRLRNNNEGVRLLLLGPDPRFGAKAARTICRALDIPLLEFDVRAALRSASPWEQLVDFAFREARLLDAALLFQGCDAVLAAEQDHAHWEHLELAASAFRGLTMAEADSSSFVPGLVSDAQFWHVDLPLPDYETRKNIWLAHLPEVMEFSASEENRTQLAARLANSFQTTEAQIEDAIAGGWNLAHREGQRIGAKHLFEACRRLAGRRLVRFAQRIEPRPGLSLDEIVLPEPNRRQLLDLRNRIRFHRELFQHNGFNQTARLGKGLLVLFAGASGTGKTMAAEGLANGQGVDLYKVDLSAVVSKWIGETEKNLSRIFDEAETSNGWLFFDEGESLFGTRGDIKQAQDRFLNLEVNYLLQRVEDFSGVVILATNLRQNIDDAFLRRIHAVVEFPQPGPQSRAAIWQKLTPGREHRDFDDQQLRKFATRFELSGGNIRNIVLDAMFRAYASEGKVLTLRHLAAGVAREYQKLGRPVTNAEFGEPFYKWVVEDILDPKPAEGVAAT